MSCAAVIAFKGIATAKSRLAGVLSPALRHRLVEVMLAQVIRAAQSALRIAEIFVVSTAAHKAAESAGSVAAVIDGAQGLSAAFECGALRALALRHRSVLLLPADLALVTAEDLDAMVALGCESGAALAPNMIGAGTNALYLPLPLPIRLAFGPCSCARHVAACRACGYAPAIVERSRLALDIDAPGDLERLRGVPAYSFLGEPARSVA